MGFRNPTSRHERRGASFWPRIRILWDGRVPGAAVTRTCSVQKIDTVRAQEVTQNAWELYNHAVSLRLTARAAAELAALARDRAKAQEPIRSD